MELNVLMLIIIVTANDHIILFIQAYYNMYIIGIYPQYIHNTSVDLFHRFKLVFL
jgi:hypothetical protein